MKCPICGAKMVAKQLCPYCRITDAQVLNASNSKVPEYRKQYKQDSIHYTTVIPKDVSRLKLILFTIFLGIFGVHNFYVHRNIKGFFSVVSVAGSLLMLLFSMAIPGATSIFIFKLIFDIFFFLLTINVIFYIFDIIAVVFKSYKIPVVLADKKR